MGLQTLLTFDIIYAIIIEEPRCNSCAVSCESHTESVNLPCQAGCFFVDVTGNAPVYW